MKNNKSQQKAVKIFSCILLTGLIFLFNFSGCKINADTRNGISGSNSQASDNSEISQNPESDSRIKNDAETTYSVLQSSPDTGSEQADQEDKTGSDNTGKTPSAEGDPADQDLADSDEAISKNPVVLGTFKTKGVPSSFIIKDNLAFVAWGYVDGKGNSFGGLSITDATDKNNPISVAAVDLKGIPFDMAIDKNFCYILWGKEDLEGKKSGGLSIIDISSKNNPKLKSEINFDSIPLKMYVNENYLYIVCQTHLSVIDVTNKEMPETLNLLEINKSIKHIIMTQNYQYLITEEIIQNDNTQNTVKSTLEIIGINDSTSLVRSGSIDFDGSVYDISVEKDFAFLLAGDGLKVISIKNKNTPVISGFAEMSGNYLKIKDNTAFIGSALGIISIDLVNKENLQKEPFYKSEHLASNIDIFGKYLYLTWTDRNDNKNYSAVESGIEIFDTGKGTGNRTSIVENLFIQNYILNIYKDQNYLFIAWGTMEKDYYRSGGITIVKLY